MTALRVGVDVGGTFTDAVAIDALTRTIVARVKVPTTHGHADGVAAGIVDALGRLLAEPGVKADAIAFIAHSTTQATNALLEGDVARVGVVGLLDAVAGVARSQIAFSPMKLGSGSLAPMYRFARATDRAAIETAVDALIDEGAEAIVATGAFGVDRPARESSVVTYARSRGAAATAGHEVATLYGLRARTRTAVLNASILPRMIATSAMTTGAVQRAGINAPLMIMRSDGGVMDVGEVARKPILTMLSGPAAGIAGALLHENVTDGIFLEVGGTSADCSVIRRGLPQLRAARIGAHRTMLRSLDVRTIAIAGGSLVRVDTRASGTAAVIGAGPRSAHIAGLGYATFQPPEAFDGAQVTFVEEDAASHTAYVALALADGRRVALTPTCAANLLGYVPGTAFAKGDPVSAARGFAVAGASFGCDGDAFARALLDRCARVIAETIDELADDYELDRASLELIGGGGGAAAIVPFVAQQLRVRHRLARDAEVISPVGVALALVRDVVERTIASPSAADIVRVRREAVERVVASGADPALVEVTIEIDARRSLVRAIAQGATPAGVAAGSLPDATGAQRLAAAATALHAAPEGVEAIAQTETMTAYRLIPGSSGWRQLFSAPARWNDVCVVDRRAIVRLIARRSIVERIVVADLDLRLTALLEATTAFGDVGRALPDVALAYGDRLANLGAMAEPGQAIAVALEEVRGLGERTPVLAIASRRNA